MVLVARHPIPVNYGLSASLSSHSNEWTSSIVPVPPHRTPWTPKSRLKGLFAGSGNGAMSHPHFARSVVDLTRRSAKDVNLLYIGTASYDLPAYRDVQTSAFASLGCSISTLDVADASPPPIDLEAAVESAHVVLVSGGNTLYAVDRWRALGLDGVLRDAATRGTVVAGGSAGCICWFDGGHSDSMDPDSYRLHKLAEHQRLRRSNPNSGSSPAPSRKSSLMDEGASARANSQEPPSNSWSYIRVSGLGIFPGLVCPHYDRIQSNGIPRRLDFDEMMERHSSELGLGIDHFAALEIDGDDFRILSIPGEAGSMPSEGGSMPGAWIKYVDEEGVKSAPCPSRGKVEDLLQAVKDPRKHIWLDGRVEVCREENPAPCMDRS